MMEPEISADGRYLFFNNSNAPGTNTDLFYARRIDDLTFEFVGRLGGANSAALDGVAAIDAQNHLYFITTRSYDQTLSTVYSGKFADGALSKLAIVPGIAAARRGQVYFDVHVSKDGDALYLASGEFRGGPVPETADLVLARRSGETFTVSPRDADVFKNINTSALEYAAAVSSDQRELFFTRFDARRKDIAIMRATRATTDQPFAPPMRIAAITGFVEAPTLTPDERAVYFHRKDGGRHVLYRTARR